MNLLGDFCTSDADSAPYDELYVRNIERETFWNEYTHSMFTYNQLSAQIKKFGGSGLTQLNDKHLKACFAQADVCDGKVTKEQGRACFFKQHESKYNMVQMLTVAFILCPHQNAEAQCEELWLLCNPTLDDVVPSRQIEPLITCIADVAVDGSLTRLNSVSNESNTSGYVVAQTQSSLRYMDSVKRRKD